MCYVSEALLLWFSLIADSVTNYSLVSSMAALLFWGERITGEASLLLSIFCLIMLELIGKSSGISAVLLSSMSLTLLPSPESSKVSAWT